MIPLLMHKIFPYQKLSKTPKGSPVEIFGSVGQQHQIFCDTLFKVYSIFPRATDGQRGL